ncbi:MAG TPA: amino acid ABC transporter substrate-binding protein [Azospirillum sp.]|nr:amino acid ABC transporter substrate-binding protein [Azospirillum sp.]
MRRTISLMLFGLFMGVSVSASAQTSKLDEIRERGTLRCGVTPLGESLTARDVEGRFVGFYPDFCRAIATAVTGSTEGVEFVLVGTNNRFDAIRSPELDVLVEATTWTLSRATGMELSFTAPYLFDGQAFLVSRKAKYRHIPDLKGASVCVESDSTSLENLKAYNTAKGLGLNIMEFSTIEAAFSALAERRCDAASTDYTILASVMLSLASDPAEFALLPELISKEPLTPVVRAGDEAWASVVRWVVHATLEAEEMGVTAANADRLRKEGSPEVRRFLGAEPGFGKTLGLDDAWAYRVVKAVGNYGEIFARNLGEGSRLKLPRASNALWRDGGLLWAPPMR